MADNFQELVDAGVIPKGARLTAEEQKVIDGLSPQEVSTLKQIRANLHKEVAATKGEDPEKMSLSESDMNANFIV